MVNNPFDYDDYLRDLIYNERTGKLTLGKGEIFRRALDPALQDPQKGALEDALDIIDRFGNNEYVRQLAIETAYQLRTDQDVNEPTGTGLSLAGLPNKQAQYNMWNGYDFSDAVKSGQIRTHLTDPTGDYSPVIFSEEVSEVQLPTSSTFSKAHNNMGRPRTVAAAYSPNKFVMTIIFRDGTFYNYYAVTYNEWLQFKGAQSKGAVLLQENWKSKVRGPADMSEIDESVRVALAGAAGLAQRLLSGQALSRSKRTKKGTRRKNFKEVTQAKKIVAKELKKITGK